MTSLTLRKALAKRIALAISPLFNTTKKALPNKVLSLEGERGLYILVILCLVR